MAHPAHPSAADAAWREWPAPQVGELQREWHDGRCAMCGSSGRTVEDHCHATGFVRGFLCEPCNAAEPHGRGVEWEAWRAWDNPARKYGWCQVYASTFGATPLATTSPLSHMSTAEREEWWAENLAAAAAGFDWPIPVALSESARSRAAEFDAELDRIATAVTEPDDEIERLIERQNRLADAQAAGRRNSSTTGA